MPAFLELKKRQKIVLLVAKLTFLLLLGWSLSVQIDKQGDLRELWASYKENRPSSVVFLWVGVGLLSLLNWGIEALKWQMSLGSLVQISYLQSFRGILAGISLAFFTPNRIGEYGGRIWLLPSAVPKGQAVLCLLQSNIAQLIVNFGIGGMGFAIFGYVYMPFENYYYWAGAVVGALVYFSIIVGFYFNIAWFQKKIPDRYTAKITPYFEAAAQVVLSARLSILGFSLLRYATYITQYILLLWVSGVQIPIAKMLVFSLSSFFIQTILPTIVVFELGIKGNVALYFFGQSLANPVSVLAATFFLWVINLAIPALVGAWVWFFRSEEITAISINNGDKG